MQLLSLGNAVLTTRHSASNLGQPVLVYRKKSYARCDVLPLKGFMGAPVDAASFILSHAAKNHWWHNKLEVRQFVERFLQAPLPDPEAKKPVGYYTEDDF